MVRSYIVNVRLCSAFLLCDVLSYCNWIKIYSTANAARCSSVLTLRFNLFHYTPLLILHAITLWWHNVTCLGSEAEPPRPTVNNIEYEQTLRRHVSEKPWLMRGTCGIVFKCYHMLPIGPPSYEGIMTVRAPSMLSSCNQLYILRQQYRDQVKNWCCNVGLCPIIQKHSLRWNF